MIVDPSRKIIVQGILGLILIFALTYGRPLSLPGNISTLYGLPLTWGIHTMSTIAGPADNWTISIPYIMTDLVLWVVILIISPIIAERFTVETCRKCIERIGETLQ